MNVMVVILLATCHKYFADIYALDGTELNDLLKIIFPLAGITVANILGVHLGAIFALAIQSELVLVFLVI